jgi:hypothetical protein
LPFVGPIINYPALLDGKSFAYKTGGLGTVLLLIGRAEYGFKIHGLSPEKLSRSAKTPAILSEHRPATLRTNKKMSSSSKLEIVYGLLKNQNLIIDSD